MTRDERAAHLLVVRAMVADAQHREEQTAALRALLLDNDYMEEALTSVLAHAVSLRESVRELIDAMPGQHVDTCKCVRCTAEHVWAVAGGVRRVAVSLASGVRPPSGWTPHGDEERT